MEPKNIFKKQTRVRASWNAKEDYEILMNARQHRPKRVLYYNEPQKKGYKVVYCFIL